MKRWIPGFAMLVVLAGVGKRKATLAAAGLLFLAVFQASVSDAWAAIITYNFTSTVSYCQNQPVLGITTTIGTPVSGMFAFDTSALDTSPNIPFVGRYPGAYASISIGGVTVTSSQSAFVEVLDANAPDDHFNFRDGVQSSGDPIFVNGLPMTTGVLWLSLSSPDGSVFSNDSLPSAAQLEQLQPYAFRLQQTDTSGVIFFTDSVSATVTTVPEPSTIVIWSGLGVTGLIAAWRRRKRAA
jgi:hypothetical protein